MIDITKPLELSDGTPCRYKLHFKSNYTDWIEVDLNSGIWYFHFDGSPHTSWREQANGRTLRNVKESEMRTGLEHVERMEALLRRIVDARKERIMLAQQDELHIVKEAREIVAELDGPKGPQTDEEWANLIVEECNGDTLYNFVKAGIAKGRELALAEVAGKLHEAKYFRAFHLLGLQHVK